MSVQEFLRSPDAYPWPTTNVKLIETHISWVFLTDQYAFKLKKPVRFEFLDFSTIERRRDACQKELELNRRLAPDVYLDVLRIVEKPQGQLSIGGEGTTVDWIVQMKRLPEEQAFDRLIEKKAVEEQHIRELISTLTRFYQQLKPINLPSQEYWDTFEQHIRANWEELGRRAYNLDQNRIGRIHGNQLRYLNVYRDQLVRRIEEGRIIDGHGDLRPDHIYFTPSPVIIDCIEFSSQFRTLDVADELSFLAMECHRLGAAEIGDRILDETLAAVGNQVDEKLLKFFKSYRACVRAKVQALRSKQQQGNDAANTMSTVDAYLRYADEAAEKLGQPILLVVRGLSGTGKSTIARSVAQRWGASLLQTDILRRELFESARKEEGFEAGKYSQENREKVYEEMFRRAADELNERRSVVLDGTFLNRALRERAMDLAEQFDAAILFVVCRCPLEVTERRVRKRAAKGGSASEVQVAYLAEQKSREEPDDPAWPVCVLDTSGSRRGLDRTIDDAVRGVGG